MPETMQVIGWGKVARKSLAYFGITSSLLLTGGIYWAVKGIYNSYQLDWNRESVEEMIKEKDFPAASQLIASFENEGMLRLEDKVALELSVKRAKGEYRFSTLLTEGKLAQAENFLEGLQETGIHLPDQIEKLSDKLASYSEESLYARLLSSPPSKKQRAAETYLKFYEGGAHHKEVVTYLLISSLDKLSDILERKEQFPIVYSSLQETNLLLEKYRGQGVLLSGITLFSELEDKVKEYIKSENIARELKVGSPVVVIPAEGEKKDWRDGYLKEREQNFPVGSRGNVIRIFNNKIIAVKFPGIAATWSKGWSEAKNYWTDEKKNAAGYLPYELIFTLKITPLEKAFLNQEMGKLEGLLKHY